MLYLVLVKHDTGCGPSSAIALATENFQLALKTAREAKSFGYEFYSSESGVSIFRLGPDQILPKEALKFSLRPPKNYPVVIRLSGRGLTEEWFDEEMKKRFGEN